MSWLGNPIMERLNRWADNTPTGEPIPIGIDEIYDICMLMDGMACRYSPSGKPIRNLTELEILESLRKNAFYYREHQLVIV